MNKNAPEIKVVDEEVDGQQFKTTQFPAMRGFKVLARLVNLIGPALASLGAGVDAGDSDATKQKAVMSGLAGAFRVDPEECLGLIKDLLANTQARTEGDDGAIKWTTLSSPEAIDRVFSGHLLRMVRVATFAARINFPDFFEMLLAQNEEPAKGTATP